MVRSIQKKVHHALINFMPSDQRDFERSDHPPGGWINTIGM
jgi:hypothetical protein